MLITHNRWFSKHNLVISLNTERFSEGFATYFVLAILKWRWLVSTPRRFKVNKNAAVRKGAARSCLSKKTFVQIFLHPSNAPHFLVKKILAVTAATRLVRCSSSVGNYDPLLPYDSSLQSYVQSTSKLAKKHTKQSYIGETLNCLWIFCNWVTFKRKNNKKIVSRAD